MEAVQIIRVRDCKLVEATEMLNSAYNLHSRDFSDQWAGGTRRALENVEVDVGDDCLIATGANEAITSQGVEVTFGCVSNGVVHHVMLAREIMAKFASEAILSINERDQVIKNCGPGSGWNGMLLWPDHSIVGKIPPPFLRRNRGNRGAGGGWGAILWRLRPVHG